MPPPLDSKSSSWESTPTILQQGDAEKGQVEGSSNSYVDETNEKDENKGGNPQPSINSKNETDGDIPAELDSELIVWWDGPKDPENPMNWSSTWKWVNICIISVISFLVPLVSSMLAPGVQLVMEDFNTTSPTFATFVVSIFVLGFACGPLILAPLSELYGRVIIYNTTNVLFLAFTILCAVSQNPPMLLAFRFLSGFAGVATITIGSGTIADIMPREKRGKAVSIWSVGPILGPMVGPIIGGVGFFEDEESNDGYNANLVTVYAFTTASTGLVFLAGGLGTLMGLFYVGYFSDRTLIKRAATGKTITPEDRLPFIITIPGSLTFPFGLFVYGWTAQEHVHWIVPQIGTAITGFGSILIFVGIQTYLVDAFEEYAASVIGANAVLRGTAGALIPLAGLSMYDGLGWGWGNSLLAFVALAFAPMPWVFGVYGAKIRGWKGSKVTL